MTRSTAHFVAFAATLALTALAALAGPAGGLAGPASSHAQAPDAHEPPPEAVEFYAHGRQLYQEGRYREAAVELERALMLDPTSPNLMFNVARVYELLGELDKSIDFYGRYLRLLGPEETEERGRVEATVRRLEGARGEVGAQVAAPPQGDASALRDPQPVRSEKPGVADAAFWITASTSAALLLGGTLTGVLALGAEKSTGNFVVGSDGTFEDRQAIADRADMLALVTDILWIGGGVAALTSVLLFALRSHTVERYPGADGDVQADLAVLPGGAFLSLRGAL